MKKNLCFCSSVIICCEWQSILLSQETLQTFVSLLIRLLVTVLDLDNIYRMRATQGPISTQSPRMKKVDLWQFEFWRVWTPWTDKSKIFVSTQKPKQKCYLPPSHLSLCVMFEVQLIDPNPKLTYIPPEKKGGSEKKTILFQRSVFSGCELAGSLPECIQLLLLMVQKSG